MRYAVIVVWVILVLSGLAAIAVGLESGGILTGFLCGLVCVATWSAWGGMVTFLVGIRRHVARHMGRGWQKGAVLTHKVRTGERVNLQAALNTLVEGMGRQPCLFGLETSDYQHSRLGANLISRISFNPWPLPIVWDSLPCASGRDMSVADDALYLVRGSDGPFCAYVMKQSKDQRKQAILVILARSLAAARNSLDELLRLAERQSHYRGNVISVKHHDPTEDDFTVEFHTLAPVDRDAIVLPENVLRVAERNTIGFIRNAAALRQAGRDTRHGVLLYGPPGTGKTLVTRYLASQSSPCTVILLSGRQYAYLRTACQLARALAPSLVVLEDVDLIAADRRKNRHAPLLHELMDEMDGLGSGADCTFLLTTNRPDALEPALAARPGRVDQAVYFPLPDLECRRRLLRQFGNGLDLNGVEQEPFLQRTEGASPAFLKELVRRSALMAVERGERSSPLRLTNEDFVQALRELVEFGGKLTRNFLGFPASEPPQPR